MFSDSDDDVYDHIISEAPIVNKSGSSAASRSAYTQKATLPRPPTDQNQAKRPKTSAGSSELPKDTGDEEFPKVQDAFEQEHARQVDEVDGGVGKVELRHQVGLLLTGANST